MVEWYVTVDSWCSSKDDPNARVWTLSRSPDRTGWETDSGHRGYGLKKADAEELADAANRIKFLEAELARKDAALTKIASANSVQAGTDRDMYRRWRKVATDAIDEARAALAPAQEKTDE